MKIVNCPQSSLRQAQGAQPKTDSLPGRAARPGARSAMSALPLRTVMPPAPAGTTGPDTFSIDLTREVAHLRGYAIWLCRSGDLADDLLQETLLKALLARNRFQAGTNLKAWCTTILRNTFFSYKRRSWRWQPLPDEGSDEPGSEDGEASHMLDLLALRNALALLPAEQRAALVVVCVGGQSYIEAANTLACAVGTVKSRVSRARARLAALVCENKAGFNSDPGLSAGEVLNDLMDQFARLNASPVIAGRCAGRRGTVAGVHEPQTATRPPGTSPPAEALRQ